MCLNKCIHTRINTYLFILYLHQAVAFHLYHPRDRHFFFTATQKVTDEGTWPSATEETWRNVGFWWKFDGIYEGFNGDSFGFNGIYWWFHLWLIITAYFTGNIMDYTVYKWGFVSTYSILQLVFWGQDCWHVVCLTVASRFGHLWLHGCPKLPSSNLL